MKDTIYTHFATLKYLMHFLFHKKRWCYKQILKLRSTPHEGMQII